ncbi:MAG TPA: hypothetical protein VKT78_17390, partial [Fimbriimonadaceae bacterium]|nr:hypothetical protein [Fimbriimonadaceae bacterium]
VVGTWQAYLGSGKAAKLYYGRPEPTEIEFRDDGTYSLRLMWGARTVAQTGGDYRVEDDRIQLEPWENLDRGVWPGREEARLSPSGRSFVLELSPKARIRRAEFVKSRFR